MKFTIGKFDAGSRSVPVTFEDQGVTHSRPVNAVVKASGAYDATATKLRVEQVALGVSAKIAAGVIANAEPAEEA